MIGNTGHFTNENFILTTDNPSLSHTGVLSVVFQLMPTDARDEAQQSMSFRPMTSVCFGCFRFFHKTELGPQGQ